MRLRALCLRGHVGHDVMLADAAVVLEPDAVRAGCPSRRSAPAGTGSAPGTWSTCARCDLMNRSRRKNSCGGISGKHSLQRRGEACVHSSPLGPHHLPVAVADRQVLVQRVEDRHIREQAPDRRHDVEADEERVLEMDDVGLVCLEEVGDVPGVEALVARRHREEVEVARLREQEVLVRVVARHAERRARVRRCASDATFGPMRATSSGSNSVGLAQRLVQLERVGLRSAREQRRVVVEDVQDLCLLHARNQRRRGPESPPGAAFRRA